MALYGITKDGFRRKVFSQIVSDEEALLRQEWRADLDFSDRAPLTHVVKADATEKDLLGQGSEAIFYSYFLQYARGDALDNLVRIWGIKRFGAERSVGQVTLSPVAEGAVIPQGFTFLHQSGLLVRTTKDALGTALGAADAWAEPLIAGSLTNFAPNSTWTLGNATQGVSQITNQSESAINHFGATTSLWAQIPNDGKYVYYQSADVTYFGHPIGLDSFTFTIKNETGVKDSFTLRLAVLDHATGQIIKKSGLATYILDDDEVRQVTISGVRADVTLYDDIDIAIVNQTNSGGAISVAVDSTNNYGGGAWYFNSAEQVGKDLVLTVTSQIDGEFRNGRDIETDPELSARGMKVLHLGGSGREPAILSELFTLPGVLDAQMIRNTDPANWQQWILNPELDNPSNRPPGTIEVIVWGGIEQEIGDKLGVAKGSGAAFVGDVSVFYTDTFGQVHVIKFSRPIMQEVWAKVYLIKNSFFRPGLEEQVKNEVIRYLGGVDGNNISFRGRGVAERVSHSAIESRILNIRGVDSVKVELSTNGTAYSHEDFVTPDRTVAFSRLENITLL